MFCMGKKLLKPKLKAWITQTFFCSPCLLNQCFTIHPKVRYIYMLYFIRHFITSKDEQFREYIFGAVFKEGGRDLSRSFESFCPSSCATCCLRSRALRASPGINDHYGSIRAATQRSLCYTEKRKGGRGR